MSLIVEDGTVVANADSFLSLIDARALAENYGLSLSDADTEAQASLAKRLSDIFFSKEEGDDKNETKESDDIHQKMYEIASKNWSTVAETQGGSENFQSGPGGWNSGNGMGQFL